MQARLDRHVQARLAVAGKETEADGNMFRLVHAGSGLMGNTVDLLLGGKSIAMGVKISLSRGKYFLTWPL